MYIMHVVILLFLTRYCLKVLQWNQSEPFEALWKLYRVELRGMGLIFTSLLAIDNYSRWCRPNRQIFHRQWYNEEDLFWNISWDRVAMAVPRVRGDDKPSLYVLEKRKISFSCRGSISGFFRLNKSLTNRWNTRTYGKKHSLRICAVERGILTGKEKQSRSGKK